MIRAVILLTMMLHGIILDRGSRISLRRQLVGHLESRILGGQIGPGRRLPSVRRAEELLGLHRNTIAAAYRDLVQAGLAQTRPGSGVYARSPADARSPGVALVTVLGSRDVGLDCEEPELRAVLAAELRSRLALRVHPSSEPGPHVRIRLAAGPEFIREVASAPHPSLVSVCTGSDRVQRLASAAVLIHGGEGIAYLPVIPGNHDSADRARRLSRFVAADYAALPWARHRLPARVVPLSVISGHSFTELTLLLRRREVRSGLSHRPSYLPERTMPTSVEEA